MGAKQTSGPRNFIADRLNDGESLEQRAARIGIARGTLSAIEGEPSRMPNVSTAKRVADFYGCLVTDLWPIEHVDVVGRSAENAERAA